MNKYEWIDIGASFLPSEITAAFLYAQLEKIDEIQSKRRLIWNSYFENLKTLSEERSVFLPSIPSFCNHNAHIFYLLCGNEKERDELLNYMNINGVNVIFHYLSLHKSPFYQSKCHNRVLPVCDRYASTLVRLPLYFELSRLQTVSIADLITNFYNVGP